MLKFPQFLEGVWIRTCQECMHRQIAKNPNFYKNDSWRDLKCKKM